MASVLGRYAERKSNGRFSGAVMCGASVNGGRPILDGRVKPLLCGVFCCHFDAGKRARPVSESPPRPRPVCGAGEYPGIGAHHRHCGRAGAGETALLFSTNAKLPCGGNGRLYGSVRKRPILRLTLVRSVEQRAGLWLLLVESRHCKQSSATFDMACARVSSIESEPTTDESDNR